MIDSKLATWAVRLARLVIGATFVYAGVVKTLSPIRFMSDIHNYRLLPWSMAVALAFYLPWLEIVCGLALLTARLYRAAIVLLIGVNIIFIVASASARIRGIDISCGCFGHLSNNLSFSWHLGLNMVLLVLLLALWRWKHSPQTVKA
jgi:putative oxidoreductase